MTLFAGMYDENNGKNSGGSGAVGGLGPDPWGTLLFGLMHRSRVPATCPTAVHHAWPILYARINALYVVIDPT